MERYAQALKRLYQVNKFKKKKMDLSTLQKAAELIGNPHKGMNFIHIAGTNGKGTVALKCAKIFEYAGYNTGLFISPHIFTFRERIQLNGRYIDKEFVTDYLEFLFNLSEKHHLDLTYFEYITLMGLEYYKQQKADIVSLEVGMGGRLDATNIVDPLISIIVSIGLDHRDSLGDTIYDIAREKAGIIKPNRPVIVGPCTPEEIFIEKADQTKSEFHLVEADRNTVRDFDIENAKIVQQAINVIKQKYPQFNLTDEAINRGLEARLPFRMQYLNPSEITSDPRWKDRTIILDVGHNPPALEKLMLSLIQKHPEAKFRVIYGTSAEKDAYDSIQVLKDYATKIHLVQAKHSRAMDIQKLIQCSEQVKFELTDESNKSLFENVVDSGDVRKTINFALEQSLASKENEVVVIVGSFYLMAEVRQSLGFKDETDPIF